MAPSPSSQAEAAGSRQIDFDGDEIALPWRLEPVILLV